jgi:hypothetical protein
MARSRRFKLVAIAVVAVIVAAAVLVLFAVGVLVPARSPTTTPTPAVKTYVNLTIAYDAATGIGNYTTPFISMIAQTLVVVTITNHDPSASTLFVPWDNHVVGTVGGNMSVNCGSGTEIVRSLPSNDISHTFTVLDSFYNISVPIPPAPSLGVPCSVTFELTMSHSEETIWGCVANCDGPIGMRANDMWGYLLITG